MNFLTFEDHGTTATGKTKLWRITANSVELGWIKWFSNWRKYVFEPNDGTIYDSSCLKEIALFCQSQTDNHKALHSVQRKLEAEKKLQ